MKEKKEKTRTEKLAERTEGFLGNNKKIIIALIALILVVVIAVAIAVGAYNRNVSNKYEELYNLEQSYNTISSMDETSSEYATSVSDFENDVNSFVSRNSINDYLGAKATMLLAEVKFLENDWDEAYALYLTVADAHSSDYLGPVNYLNAAVAAENNSNTTEALRLYSFIWDNYGVTCPEAPQALFNQARLEYASGNTEVARSIFEQLTSEFPQSYYASIASSWLLVY